MIYHWQRPKEVLLKTLESLFENLECSTKKWARSTNMGTTNRRLIPVLTSTNPVSTQIIRNFLRSSGLYTRRCLDCVSLTAKQKKTNKMWMNGGEYYSVIDQQLHCNPVILVQCDFRNNAKFLREIPQYLSDDNLPNKHIT
ncbi:hypothetical protein Trydic_g20245 [Trypoxylus dichotomus]